MACIARKVWGARSAGTGTKDTTKKTKVGVHHTVSPNKRWSRAAEREHMRQIEAGHLARGFSTVGYHRVVFPSGRCYIGRPLDTIPAAQGGANSGSWAIAYVGNTDTKVPTRRGRRTIRKFIEARRADGATRLGGHQEFDTDEATACPGGKLLPFMQRWRNEFGMRKP